MTRFPAAFGEQVNASKLSWPYSLVTSSSFESRRRDAAQGWSVRTMYGLGCVRELCAEMAVQSASLYRCPACKLQHTGNCNDYRPSYSVSSCSFSFHPSLFRFYFVFSYLPAFIESHHENNFPSTFLLFFPFIFSFIFFFFFSFFFYYYQWFYPARSQERTLLREFHRFYLLE